MAFQRQRITKADGRYLWYYSWDRPTPKVEASAGAPALESEGLSLRWHPLLEEWIVVAPERQERTFLPPAKYCPLCATLDATRPTEVPSAEYEIVVFENRFPSLRRNAPKASRVRAPFATERARGAAEVVLGARLTGAGFGGCTVQLVQREAVEAFAREVVERYRGETGLPAKLHVCHASAGLRLHEVSP